MIAEHNRSFPCVLNSLKHNSGSGRNLIFKTEFFILQTDNMKTLFKLLIFTAALVIAAPKGDAQVLQRQITSSPYKDSVTGAGTKYFNFYSTPNGLTGISFSGIKAETGGGTVDSYVILQVRTDTMPSASTASWVDYVYPGTTKRDTLFLTNLTTVQGYQWPVPVHFFNGVRAKVVSTGAQKFYVYFSQLRR